MHRVGRQHHILSVGGYALTHYGLRSLELMRFSSCRKCEKISICFGVSPFSSAFSCICYYRDKGKHASYVCGYENTIHKIDVLYISSASNNLTSYHGTSAVVNINDFLLWHQHNFKQPIFTINMFFRIFPCCSVNQCIRNRNKKISLNK